MEMKGSGRPIVCLTAYDCPTAALLDEADLDVVLVGDSLGTVLLGHGNTTSVTMREMLHHTQAVSRGLKQALLVADMPFGSYETSPEAAYRNAVRLIRQGGADAVKLEGGRSVADTVKALTSRGISVMGHVGLMPQRAQALGGYKVQGKTEKESLGILEDARSLEAAGVFSVVLECIPEALAEDITCHLRIPTIGIGAGPHCDGQIMVIADLVGLTPGPHPKFVRRYADLAGTIRQAAVRFRDDVRAGRYPSEAESYHGLVRAGNPKSNVSGHL